MFHHRSFFLIIALIFSSVAATPFSQDFSQPTSANTNDILQHLGGQPCFDGSAFTCVTIDVPLDHFNSSDLRTIPVVFAVLPATGTRKGMFVTVTGGPGTSGIQSADSYTDAFDPSIPQAFDIVFFDQRGVGLSGGLDCTQAAVTYYLQDGRGITPAQEKALKQTVRTFSTDCVNEMGNPEILPYLGTAQAVEDLEYFRNIIGDDQFWLYGESYGTQYAQTYAAKYPEHLAGLILDGTVDLSLSGFEYYKQQAKAFSDTLLASFSACNDDPSCAKKMNNNAIKAYDKLAAQLNSRPISFRFPLPEGGFDRREFTFSNLEFVAASQMYNEGDRMMFNRALSSYAANGDIVPLARLLYISLGLDPQTLEPVPQSYYSDAVYYGVECQDYGYPGNTAGKKAQNYILAGNPVEASIPRLASIFYGDLPCAYWPNPTSNLDRPDYLYAEGVPTLVLGATADPATPVGNGISVYQHLADGYLITQQGGPHVIFGRGNVCPDAIVTDFLVNDVVPAERETTCDGVVADDYVPIAPLNASEFKNPLKGLASAETEINYLPEYYYWDGLEPTSAGCAQGGILSFAFDGSVYDYTLNNCTFTNNFTMTGTGSYNPDTDTFLLKVATSGRWQCNLEYTRTVDDVKVKGKCDGKSVMQGDKEQGHHHHWPFRHHKPDPGH